MSKVAAKKTAGVLGDDLALNAQQVTGVRAERELPVVWAVAKGSLRNKVILVPGALLISAFIPWLITPLLMLGGAFLCYEGFEKLAHRFLHDDSERHAEKLQALSDPKVEDRKSTRLNSSHVRISYAVFCLKKKKKTKQGNAKKYNRNQSKK